MASGNRNVQTPVEQSSLKVYYSKHNSEVHDLTGILGNSYSTQLAFVQSTQNFQDISAKRKQNDNVEIKGVQSTMQFERTNNSNKSSIAVADGHNNQKAEEISQGLPPTSEFFVAMKWPRKSWRRSKYKTNLYRIPDDYLDENQQSAKQTKTHLRSRRIYVLICCCTFVILTVLAAILGTVLSSNEITPTVTSREVTFLSLSVYYSSTMSLLSTASVLATETPIQDFRCSNITGELYKGPVTMPCILGARSDFDKIAISHVTDNNILFAVELHKNGSKNFLKPDSNISAIFDGSQVNIAFLNVSCQMDGMYHVYLVNSSNYLVERTFGHLTVASPPEIPTLTLNADQVIDLVFEDGNFYRLGKTHVCEGNIGHPPGSLAVDILYVNKSIFENIPKNSYKEISRVNITMPPCSNCERIEFAIKFSEEMQGAILRCRVPGAFNNGTVQQLTLIPRNFCSCAKPNTLYEHPTRCDAVVQCNLANQIMYPFGLQCSPDKCSNSTTGMCSHNCLQHDCIKNKPADLCMPQTPASSAYISCNETVYVMLSSDTDILCTLNQTTLFDSINISKISNDSIKDIAQISREGAVIKRTTDGNLNITFIMNRITIRLSNVSCTDEGTYIILMDIYSEVVKEQTQLSVFQKPNVVPKLTLNADQIADLGTYRSWLLHSCTSEIGYPVGQMHIEILLKGENDFKMVYNTDKLLPKDSITNCVITRKIEFGIVFTSNMTGSIIRCSVQSDQFGRIYSNNETVSLIPYNFCENNTKSQSYYPHPEDCNKFVQCEKNVTYSLRCPPDQCFGTNSIDRCDFCRNVQCYKVTTQPTTVHTTIAAENIQDMNCTRTSDFIGRGPVNIECSFLLSSILISINISRTVNLINHLLATVSSDGTVNMVETDVKVSYSQTNVSTIVLSFSSMSCADEADYYFVAALENVTVIGVATLVAKAKPGKPTLTLSDQTVLNGDSLPSVCRANVGNPEGRINILVKSVNESEYRKYTGFTEPPNKQTVNCTTYIELLFTPVFTTQWNNTMIKCQIENDQVIDPNEDLANYTSNVGTIVLIAGDYCTGSTRYKKHPRNDCNYYIECLEDGRIFSRSCGQHLCFNYDNYNTTGVCDFCEKVNANCNFP